MQQIRQLSYHNHLLRGLGCLPNSYWNELSAGQYRLANDRHLPTSTCRLDAAYFPCRELAARLLAWPFELPLAF